MTRILNDLPPGNANASSELLPLVYEELRHQAAAQLAQQMSGQTLQATALVHEAWLRLAADGDRTWRDRDHFFRAAAQTMRHILVDRARHKLSLKRGGGDEKISLENLEIAVPAMDNRVLLVDQCLDRLEREDPESARIISLKFFAGLTNREVASILNVTERSIERQWAYARTLLFKLIQQEN